VPEPGSQCSGHVWRLGAASAWRHPFTHISYVICADAQYQGLLVLAGAVGGAPEQAHKHKEGSRVAISALIAISASTQVFAYPPEPPLIKSQGGLE
jgi:hypothetical protein